jgi:hypothetical protein
MQHLYLKELNDFCQKYLVIGPQKLTRQDELLFAPKYESIKAKLFESFLLYEKLTFKVYGENLPLVILLNEISIKGVEELIEQGCLSFVHWTPLILNFNDNIRGVEPLAFGRLNNPVHCDPEASIRKTFEFMKNKPKKKDRINIIKKTRDLYRQPAAGIENESTNFVMSALRSGKLSKLGFDGREITNLTSENKQTLNKCATELLEYKFLINENLVPHQSEIHSALLSDSIQKIENIDRISTFSHIAQLENFPNLQNLSLELGNDISIIPKLRKNKNTIKFRSYLSELTDSNDLNELSKKYISSIEQSRGFFETKKGRFTKSMIMYGVGSGLGSLAGPYGTAIGGIVGQLLSPATDIIFDLADEFLLTELLKGWTPRVFFNHLEKLR